MLVTAIAIVSAVVLAKNDDAGPNPLRIDVTAQQFAWTFEYPGESKLTSATSYLPVNETVKLTLRSLDVIHSFWVPEFGQKQDAVPGIETTLVITPNRKGDVPDRLHRALRARPRDDALGRAIVVDAGRVRRAFLSRPGDRAAPRRRPVRQSSRARLRRVPHVRARGDGDQVGPEPRQPHR